MGSVWSDRSAVFFLSSSLCSDSDRSGSVVVICRVNFVHVKTVLMLCDTMPGVFDSKGRTLVQSNCLNFIYEMDWSE